jgi:hypothetical protein
LRGGDEEFIERNLIIVMAISIFNTGSVKVAVGTEATPDSTLFSGLTDTALVWAFIVSVVVFTTIQGQDLEDYAGDQVRCRRSAPIVLGDKLARWTRAMDRGGADARLADLLRLVPGHGLDLSALQLLIGTYVALRSIIHPGFQSDKIPWR